MFKTLEWTQEGVVMIDQRKLPGEELYPVFKTYQEVAQAIRDMVVRGAPAIGVAAAMGVALGAKQFRRAMLRSSSGSLARSVTPSPQHARRPSIFSGRLSA